MRSTKIVGIFVLFAIYLAITSLSFAGVIQLPKTGQIKCYSTSGIEMNCSESGQDGEKQSGIAWPNPRFIISGDCVIDNLTGLMWTRNANIANGAKTWLQALSYVPLINNGNGICGYKDWRLPNINELLSLFNLGQTNTGNWLNTQGFSNVKSGGYEYYWSSTPTMSDQTRI